ncbi:glycine betaine ABC transporter substrate-binding protein [Paenibacillus sp. TRM 82003]|uniref:glycine betaine ABC transporter substrate-binding protein n=1 Tax=Kineococcus sp. TRM81007 TaxID=2925831 RepID=UPI001F5AEA30|nr:glycine betaine ABC transporter substrate-binding protein [Kineococcus sp. TRM81007]MCI2237099.1 glycine betaine ABC transporter substrate-binding protein [Kineococcus sp. TRM81007]MCI3926430.1 glycine betaine ABC transporter substrate-binding protein [Paenibacillus sp. TRM 82003]
MTKFTRSSRVAAGLIALGLTATACGGDEADTAATTGTDAAGGGTVTLGFLPGWTDGLSTAYLWENVLESEGYTVEMTELSDAAPLYAGLAGGDVDVYPSGWPQVTHASYMEEYGEDIEDLGAWYEGAVLTMAVPEYTDITSIEELPANVDRFGGRIVGIEPGAGLTEQVQEVAIPEYGLEDYQLQTSSTAAMLAELQSATEAQEDIVVTLWRPFWANSSFPVKDLEDPKGAMGEPETLNSLARAGFSEEMPEVAEMMSNFSLTDEQYGSLEDTVVNEYGEGRYAEGVQAWLDENPDFVESLQG